MKALFFICALFFSTGVLAAPGDDTLVKNELGLYNQGKYQECIVALKPKLEYALKQNNKDAQETIYRLLGNNYSNIGNTIEALQAYQSSITIAEQSGHMKSVGRTTANIGTLFSDNKDFEKAIKKYDEAEAISLKVNDTFNLADCANNKGVIYEQQENYNAALTQYSKALRLYESLKDDSRIALLNNNLGIVYKHLKNYGRSIACYGKSLTTAEKLGDNFMVAANQINMGNVYEMEGEYKKAIESINKGLAIGRQINSRELIIEAYNSLAENYFKMGDHKNAYLLYKAYTSAKDSLISIERSQQMAEIQTKYETEKKTKEIVLLKQEKETASLNLTKKELQLQKRNFQVWGIVLIAVLLSIVAFFLYQWQLFKQKQIREKAVLDAEYKERLRIARDVHDDLGSGLSRISLMAAMAQEKAPAELGLGKDINRISSVSKELVENMRDLIWVLNPENSTLDSLVSRLREYCGDYLDGLIETVVLDFPDNAPATPISREVQRNTFLTVKESINNCLKHAGADKISVSLTLRDEQLAITVRDNGKGFSPEARAQAGNGLRNMRQRIEAVGGTFFMTSEAGQGTSINIFLPYEKIFSGAKNTTNV